MFSRLLHLHKSCFFLWRQIFTSLCTLYAHRDIEKSIKTTEKAKWLLSAFYAWVLETLFLPSSSLSRFGDLIGFFTMVQPWSFICAVFLVISPWWAYVCMFAASFWTELSKLSALQHVNTNTHDNWTYSLLPVMRCDWSPGPDSFGPHTRSCRRRACSVVRGRCEGRRGTRWAAACGGSGGYRGLSQPAPHLCTIPPWGLDGPLPYSWEWLVPLWTQWGQRGAPQCGEGSLPGEDETLKGDKWGNRHRFTCTWVMQFNFAPY